LKWNTIIKFGYLVISFQKIGTTCKGIEQGCSKLHYGGPLTNTNKRKHTHISTQLYCCKMNTEKRKTRLILKIMFFSKNVYSWLKKASMFIFILVVDIFNKAFK